MDFAQEALKIVSEIGTNRQNLELLSQYRDQLVPFVGAGLSIGFGYPPWDTLIQELADQTGQPNLRREVDRLLARQQFEEAAEVVSSSLKNVFDDTLRARFDHGNLQRPIKEGAIRHIPYIANGPVLTTNFDRVIECAFEDANRQFKAIFSGPHIFEASQAIQLRQRLLLKLHGDYFDSQSRVLTLTQYRRVYGGDSPDKARLHYPVPKVLGQALASRPLLFLGCSLRTDRTIGIIGRLARRYEGTVHFAVLSESDSTEERRKQLDLWNIRPIFYPKREYSRVETLLACLAEHCDRGDLGKDGFLRQPRRTYLANTAGSEMVRVNGYKLFYFRISRKLSVGQLAKLAGVERRVIQQLERVKSKPGDVSPRCFHLCHKDLLNLLERLLDCRGKLETGIAVARPDDFLTQYRYFYEKHKGKGHLATRNDKQLEMKFKTRAVVFDFDGTLTEHRDDETTWEKIWNALGYPVNECPDLHRRYMQGEFTHERWCEITRDKFKAKGFCIKQLSRIARGTSLLKGTPETIRFLRNAGIPLYIVSGSIKQVIKQCLGALYDAFEEVKANEIFFDISGHITEIRGTRYDFKGKALFLKRIVAENRVDPWDVLFIGNSANDDWASLAGVRTLCINPRFTRPDDPSVWTYARSRVEDLREVLDFIQI